MRGEWKSMPKKTVRKTTGRANAVTKVPARAISKSAALSTSGPVRRRKGNVMTSKKTMKAGNMVTRTKGRKRSMPASPSISRRKAGY